MEEKKSVVDLYANGQIDRERYGKKCQTYDTDIKGVRIERDQLLAAVPALHKKDVVETSVEQYSTTLKNKWEKSTDFDSRRQLLLAHVDRIVLANGKVDLHGSIPVGLESYANPEQSSNVRKIAFVIHDSVA